MSGGAECGERAQADGMAAVRVNDLRAGATDETAEGQGRDRVDFGERTKGDKIEARGLRTSGERLARARDQNRLNAQIVERAGEPQGLSLPAAPAAFGVDVHNRQPVDRMTVHDGGKNTSCIAR